MTSTFRPAGYLLLLGFLAACGGGEGGATSPPVTQLVFKVEPGDITAHGTFDPPVSVELQDANGDRVTAATNNVRLHLKAGGGNGALTGITNRAAVGGLVTFTSLGLDTDGSYTLVAVSDGVDSVFSAPFTVDPLPPPPTAIEIQVGTDVGGNQFRSVHNGSINPAVDTLAAGGTVTWSWLGGHHGVHSVGSPSFIGSDTSSVVAHEYSLQFNTVGTYSYNCTVHGNAMTGRVDVR